MDQFVVDILDHRLQDQLSEHQTYTFIVKIYDQNPYSLFHEKHYSKVFLMKAGENIPFLVGSYFKNHLDSSLWVYLNSFIKDVFYTAATSHQNSLVSFDVTSHQNSLMIEMAKFFHNLTSKKILREYLLNKNPEQEMKLLQKIINELSPEDIFKVITTNSGSNSYDIYYEYIDTNDLIFTDKDKEITLLESN